MSVCGPGVGLNLSTHAGTVEWETLMRTARQPTAAMTVRLLDFHADWCGPCKTQDPILEELADDWDDRFELEKIDVDEKQDVANQYQVRSIPTIVIENDDGVVERFVGVTQRERIEEALEQAGA